MCVSQCCHCSIVLVHQPAPLCMYIYTCTMYMYTTGVYYRQSVCKRRKSVCLFLHIFLHACTCTCISLFACAQSIVAEACGFFQYAYQLFSTEWVTQTKDFQHLHMYLHRIALSVILPPRPLPSAATTAVETSGLYSPLRGAEAATAGSLSSPPPPNEPMSDTLPRKKHSSNPAASRKRTGSLNLPSSTKVETSPQLPVKHFPGAKPRLSKQPSIHSDGDGDFPEGTEGLSYRRAGRRVGVGSGGGGGEGCQQDVKEWRGLRLGTLRSRIQRLNVLQQTSEPGTVPDPAMLASLIDLVREPLPSAACVVVLITPTDLKFTPFCSP